MPRIVPRVVVEMQPEQYIAMLTVFKTDVIQLLVRECKRNRFDGLVSALHSRSHHPVMRMSCTSGLCWSLCTSRLDGSQMQMLFHKHKLNVLG